MTGLTALNTRVIDTLREAVALQPAADAALVGLSAGPDPVGSWAREASRVAGRYWELLREFEDFPVRAEYKRRIVELLDYHQQILRHTMRYACSLNHISDRAALSPRQANVGLGAPGEELRAILRRFDR